MSRLFPRAAMGVCWALAVSIHLTASVTPVDLPIVGIEQNTGQHDSEILFAMGQTRFYGDRIRINPNLTIRFVTVVPVAGVSGVEPVAVPLHSYLGSDPSRWRENIPHYSAVRYTRIYPGIDVEWRSGRDNPLVRVHVAPGADPKQIRMRPEGIRSSGWAVFPTTVIFWDAGFFRFDELAAYQMVGTSRLPVTVNWSQLDAETFAPVPGAYDNTLPLILEWGRGFDTASGYTTVMASGKDGSLAFNGVGSLAGLSPDGKPRFVSMVSFAGSTRWLFSDRDGSLILGASIAPGSEATVTPGAPRSIALADRGDGWIGRFDRNGRLLAATLTGGDISGLTLGTANDIYFSTYESVTKWVPGNSRFSFSVPIRFVTGLASDSSGGLWFAAFRLPGQPTTPGAFKTRYETTSDVYIGVLDRLSGATRIATYLPVYDTPAYVGEDLVYPRPTVGVAPNGSIWITSVITIGNAYAHTLVVLSGDGRRVVLRESFPSLPTILFAQESAWLALSTETPSLPTSADAPQRGGCHMSRNVYIQRRTLEGVLRDASYLDTGSLEAWEIAGFEGLGQIYYTALERRRLVRLDYAVQRQDPRIACVVHSASRRSRSVVGTGAPGGLYTLVGNKLGPVEPVNATWTADGKLPSSLAGVEVLLNDKPVPLVSVQHGLVTFHVPLDTPLGPARIALRHGGVTVATTEMRFATAVDFAVLSADGSGVGLAAALNQDGTPNSPENPAKWESVVSIFGTGPPQVPNPVGVSGLDTSLGGPVTYEYVGPAPGLFPGVTQVNLRLPPNVFNTRAGWLLIRPALAGNGHPPMMIYVAP